MNLMELFPTPEIHLGALAPILVLAGCATLGLLVEAFVPARLRMVLQQLLAFGAIIGALTLIALNMRARVGGTQAVASLVLDLPTYSFWFALLIFGLLSLFVFSEKRLNEGVTSFVACAAAPPGSKAESDSRSAKQEHTEIYPLVLFSLTGMLVFVAANDLLTLFVALEVFSLPLYIMCAMARRRRILSQEAALKYFVLGSLSSAFFLFGVALIYGYSSSFTYRDIANSLVTSSYSISLLYLGMALLLVGLLFKIGVVPFHSWTPDVYQGAPTPVTGFMAICTKAAAVAATLRVLFAALGGLAWSWQPVFAGLAVITMFFGVFVALRQKDIKRLLAYSSIAHAGFLMTAFAGAYAFPHVFGQINAVGGIYLYLVAYGFATVGAFAIVTMVRNASGEDNSLEGWQGLAKKSPFLAVAMAVFMLSFAGIPLTAGFMGKWAVFAAAWLGGYWWLVIVGIISSVIAAGFYLKVVVVMFAGKPNPDTHVGKASLWTWIPIVVCLLGTLVLGILPSLLIDGGFATLFFVG